MAKINKFILKSNPSLLKIKEDILQSDFIQHKLAGLDISKTDIEKNFAYLQICLDDWISQSKCLENKCLAKLNHYWNDFEIENNKLIKTLRPCHCLQNKKGNWTSIENISLDVFDQDLQNITLDDLESNNDTINKIKKYIEKAVAIFPQYSKPLLLLGTNQIMKRHIMAATANVIYEKEHDIAYINFENNLDELNPQNSDAFHLLKNRYKKSKALFIENIGSEKNNGFARDFFLYEVIKYRAKNKLFTIISFNYSLSWLEKTYSKNNSEIKAELLIKAIKQDYLPIEI